jgi:SAM-dependent methyltransferase
VSLAPPPRPDALRPTASDALAAWADRVRADREQVERCREVEDPADFYAPVADRFRQDPRRRDDEVLEALLALGRPMETWLDIGAGGGRYALPLALRGIRVVAVEPSPRMAETLREGMAEHDVAGIEVVTGRWPERAADAGPVDVSLIAHVGYDIEAIGPFLEAMEAATRRLCVAVVGEGAMTTAATLFWGPVHGEPRVALPALPELVTLLLARGRLPEVRLASRVPPVFETPDDLLAMARRQLWVRPGSERDRRLERLAAEAAVEREGGWTLDRVATRIGIVTWRPPGAATSA